MSQPITIFHSPKQFASVDDAMSSMIGYIHDGNRQQHLIGIGVVDNGSRSLTERFQLVLVASLTKLNLKQSQILAVVRDVKFHTRQPDVVRKGDTNYAVFCTPAQADMPNESGVSQFIRSEMSKLVNT